MSAAQHDYWCTREQVPGGACDCRAPVTYLIDNITGQRDRLAAALADAIDAMEDMRSYVPEYFAEKWEHDGAIARAKAALAHPSALVERETGPRCGCGHLTWTHRPDGGCVGCTGTCDATRRPATPDELAAIRSLQSEIRAELNRAVPPLCGNGPRFGSPEYIDAQIRRGAAECATHPHMPDGSCGKKGDRDARAAE